MTRVLRLTLNAPGARLDQALAAAYPDLSRSQWQQHIKDGLVSLAGRPVKASQRLNGGETLDIELPPPAPVDLIPEAIPLDIRYEDADCLVVNKPAGMVVHPAAGHTQGTLVNAVLAHCPDLPGIGGEQRPGIVHRLDKDTSGLLLVAKHDHALRHLQAQFKNRRVEKVYLALVVGQIQPQQALIDAPIGRDPRHRQRMAVIPPQTSASARPAQTAYRCLHTFASYALVECRPHTGRTHQIRVHLAYIGFPIVNDTLYGRRQRQFEAPGHALHAARLRFQRPADDQPLMLEAELPPPWQAILAQLA